MRPTHLFINQADPEFWRGKRVFVTGHMGFKGTWLCLLLQYLGAQVTGYDHNVSGIPTLFELGRVGQLITSVVGDMSDRPLLQQAMTSTQPEIVIHLAGRALMQPPLGEMAPAYTTYVIGTANLLEAVRQTPSVRAVVNVTCDACYQNQGWQGGYRETDPLDSLDPDSNSKACAEMLTQAYRTAFFHPLAYGEHGVAIATARSSPVIGGGDWTPDRLVPKIMGALLDGHPARLQTPRAIRPWQHVLEPLNGYLLLVERLYQDGVNFGEAWNFGPDERHCATDGAIADHLYTFWGRSSNWQVDRNPGSLQQPEFFQLDSSKAHSRLGWHLVLELKTALRWVVDWTQGYRVGADVRSLTLSQIQQFIELTHSRHCSRTLADVVQDPALMKRLWTCG